MCHTSNPGRRRRSTRPSPCRPRRPRRCRARRTRRPRRTRPTSVSPRQNSLSGVNASGPLTIRRMPDVGQRRHPDRARCAAISLEPCPVLRQQPAVEVRGTASKLAARRRPRRRVALVPAHQQAVAPPAGSRRAGRGRAGSAAAVGPVAGRRQRLGDDVLVRHRHDRHPDAGQPADLGGEHARRSSTTTSHSMSPRSVRDRGDPAPPDRRVDRRAPGCACAIRRRRRGRRRPARRHSCDGSSVAVGPGSQAAPSDAVGVHQREQRAPPRPARSRAAAGRTCAPS